MFGYVKPFQPELRVKELDAYKAVYCGLCGQLGRSYGPLARMTLSYDFTFLSMLWWGVNPQQPRVEMRRCYVNPLIKKPMCHGGEALRIGADAAAIMIYYKLLDNIRDGGIFSKIGYSLVRPFAAGAHRKAKRARPEMEALIGGQIAAQSELERRGEDSVDAACQPTAAILSGLFGSLSEDAAQQRVLERLGYLMGRFIYLCDALDDLEDDLKSGGYNPVVIRGGLEKDSDLEPARQSVTESLYMTIGEAEKTLDLLTLHQFAPVINNIIRLGLRASVDEIRSKKEKRTHDRPL